MADSKLATKQFLSARGIPVPKLIATIRNHIELEKFDFNTLPDSFVLKPNTGYGGEGIIVVEDKNGFGVWEKVNGKAITEEELREQILDILDGKFSIASLPDIAFFEARLISAELIPGFTFKGLPDIRVIVHNLIPVMAMLRVPTAASGGRANVHLGGIGIGINLASGKTNYATQWNKSLPELPNGLPTAGHQIPYWDEVLRIASDSQLHTNLGFLAADIVIDEKEGPVLIEVNARAGLMVQVANLAPLKKRLQRVRGLKVDSPEKGVLLGKELFGKTAKKKSQISEKIVVSYIEEGEVLLGESSHHVMIELDPTHETTAVDRELAEKLTLAKVGESADTVHLKVLLGGKRINTVGELSDLKDAEYKIILGRRDIQGFLIDPTSRKAKTLPKEKPKKERTKKFDFKICDKKLMALDKQIKLLHHLKPTNLLSEKKKFLAASRYNPVFHYPKLCFDADKLLKDLKKIKCPDTVLGDIFRAKKIEIERKVALLKAVRSKEFTKRSKELFGFPTKKNIELAQEMLANKPKKFFKEQPTLDSQAVQAEFRKALEKYGLKKWKVVLKEDLAADALAGKKNTIFVRSGAVFSSERLKATIAHEIGTHILRTENGKAQPYEIFARGLANYLELEEGLAIYNQGLVLNQNSEKYYWPALGLLAVEFADKFGFREVYDFARKQGFDEERAWKTALKVKRGLRDTSEPGGFTKEHLYFSGWRKIKNFVENGGDVTQLYVGKIKVEDLPLLKELKEIKPAKKLPDFY